MIYGSRVLIWGGFRWVLGLEFGMGFDLVMGFPFGFRFCGFCVDFALIFFFFFFFFVGFLHGGGGRVFLWW